MPTPWMVTSSMIAGSGLDNIIVHLLERQNWREKLILIVSMVEYGDPAAQPPTMLLELAARIASRSVQILTFPVVSRWLFTVIVPVGAA